MASTRIVVARMRQTTAILNTFPKGRSRMSRLKLYWPEEVSDRGIPAVAEASTERESSVLPFRPRHARATAPAAILPALIRAQLLRDNRSCPCCTHPIVEPIELNDARVNRSGLPIPGTATLVGFHCDGCDHEWPV
jgi:hypothetical protein